MHRIQLPVLIVCIALAAVAAACAVPAADEGDDPARPAAAIAAATLTQVSSFGSNPGNLKMFVYLPAGLASNAPVVVAMHGCTQSASVYAAQTEWNLLADRFRFAVIYPEQQRSNNSSSCFSWFQLADISRDQGEALSIKQMVDTVKASAGSDPARIFATGMSAGGFMTEVMMAAYPEVFAAGAVHSGGAYACATSIVGASACQQGNVARSPQQWGDLVRNAAPTPARPYPRLIAFHGASDTTVAPAALQQSVDQWSNVLGIDAVADVSETFRTATRKVYRDLGGRAMIETYLLAGTGHALTVDPGSAVDQGGSTGAFSEDHDIYSSYYAARFWGLISGGGSADTVAPVVSLTAPAEAATVGGTVAVTASASDNVGVARVDFLIDGVVFASDAATPYAVALDTFTLGNGAHVLGARAFDGAGNLGTAATRTIAVQNGGAGGGRLETFSTAAGPDNSGWSLGAWTLSSDKDATGSAGSRSLTATAAPRFGTVTQTASWTGISVPVASTLSYRRQLTLIDANLLASAGLRVIVNDGTDHVVDSRSISGFTSYRETVWTERTSIDLSAFAGKTVTLTFVVSASDLSSIWSSASAWVDDIRLQ
jgi:poly(hydroxyalkanoate) depolymerase family esterase